MQTEVRYAPGEEVPRLTHGRPVADPLSVRNKHGSVLGVRLKHLDLVMRFLCVQLRHLRFLFMLVRRQRSPTTAIKYGMKTVHTLHPVNNHPNLVISYMFAYSS